MKISIEVNKVYFKIPIITEILHQQ